MVKVNEVFSYLHLQCPDAGIRKADDFELWCLRVPPPDKSCIWLTGNLCTPLPEDLFTSMKADKYSEPVYGWWKKPLLFSINKVSYSLYKFFMN